MSRIDEWTTIGSYKEERIKHNRSQTEIKLR